MKLYEVYIDNKYVGNIRAGSAQEALENAIAFYGTKPTQSIVLKERHSI